MQALHDAAVSEEQQAALMRLLAAVLLLGQHTPSASGVSWDGTKVQLRNPQQPAVGRFCSALVARLSGLRVRGCLGGGTAGLFA